MVEKAVSTLKVRDLLTVTLTRWTSLISLTKTPLEEPRRSAAPAPSAEPNKANAAPRTIALEARRLPQPCSKRDCQSYYSFSPRYAGAPAMYASVSTFLRAPRRRTYSLFHDKSLPSYFVFVYSSWRSVILGAQNQLRPHRGHIAWSPAGRIRQDHHPLMRLVCKEQLSSGCRDTRENFLLNVANEHHFPCLPGERPAARPFLATLTVDSTINHRARFSALVKGSPSSMF